MKIDTLFRWMNLWDGCMRHKPAIFWDSFMITKVCKFGYLGEKGQRHSDILPYSDF